ncbi:MAG: hypothetical protein K6F93_01455 [Lachnospiraceae bacterium]|nr:hypothetical protein [Lachnospiraceae bacterium]
MRTVKKFVLSVITAISLIQIPISAHAETLTSVSAVARLKGYHIETVVSEMRQAPLLNRASARYANYVTRTKTARMKNADGDVMWQVSVTATFRYDGSSATCVWCTDSATAFGSNWSIQSSSSSWSGNSATATANVIEYGIDGISHSFSYSVTIECSASGTVS